jgi:hypothetical protein
MIIMMFFTENIHVCAGFDEAAFYTTTSVGSLKFAKIFIVKVDILLAAFS